MSTFHHFLQLPLELRQHIWELSVEAREVAVGDNLAYRSRSLSPPVMHACAESRSHLRGYYTKVFSTKKATNQYTWVNFDIDTIYASQWTLKDLVAELPFIQQLIVEGRDSETFFYEYCHPLYKMQALKTLTILHMESPGTLDPEWWMGWDSLMEQFYFGDDQVPFYTKLVNPEDPTISEINKDNYLKVERDWRRKRLAEDPSSWDPGYEVSDDDDEVMSGPGRFRTGWHHVNGCNCPYKRP
ncbi:hypothetical protein EsH8_VI_000124 [Colletotrichum jinshuiense]